MVHGLYCIYDKKAEVYAAPFASATRGTVYRQLADVVARKGDPANMLAQHPGDFELCACGGFDDETGTVHGSALEVILNLKDLVVES